MPAVMPIDFWQRQQDDIGTRVSWASSPVTIWTVSITAVADKRSVQRGEYHWESRPIAGGVAALAIW